MNSNSMRLLAIALFFPVCSMAAGWEGKIKQVAIPGGLAADHLPDSQSRGAKLYASHCSKCHNLPSPRMHSARDWPARFEKMMDHVKVISAAAPDIKMPAESEKSEMASYLQKNGFVGLVAYAPLLSEPEGFMSPGSARRAMPCLIPSSFPQKALLSLPQKNGA